VSSWSGHKQFELLIHKGAIQVQMLPYELVNPAIKISLWKNRTQTPRTSRLSTFYYCQVVNPALLRLLIKHILVWRGVLMNYNIELSNIFYHWQLSMASFRFWETYLLHIKLFVDRIVVNNSEISPFLGGMMRTVEDRYSPFRGSWDSEWSSECKTKS